MPKDPNIIIPYEDYYLSPIFHDTPQWVHDEPFYFCGKCGKELEDIGEVTGYDRFNGEKIITKYVRCPDFSNLTFGESHDGWILTLKTLLPF